MYIYPFYNDFSAPSRYGAMFQRCISDTAASMCIFNTPLESLNDKTMLQNYSDQQLQVTMLFVKMFRGLSLNNFQK